MTGVIALAADREGVIYEGAFGVRVGGQKSPMTLDSVVWTASMTKPVTAVAAMQLVEQERVALDESLSEHLPELAALQVLEGFDSAGLPRLRPPRCAITLRHLLTHTAGFAYPMWNGDLLRFQQNTGAPLVSFTAPLLFDPGERWSYGIGLDWAGRLIEQLSGQSLEKYFREHILEPLGMIDTGFVLRPDQRPRLAGRHRRQPNGSLQMIEVENPERPTFYSGGGGLYSTGPDYLRFVRMLLGGGQLGQARLLRAATVAEIARNQIGELTVGALRSVMPNVSNDVEFFPGLEKKWGLGGMINTHTAPTGRSAGSWAWAGIANTYFWVDPARGLGGLILTQISPFGDAGVLDLFAQFERLVYSVQPQ